MHPDYVPRASKEFHSFAGTAKTLERFYFVQRILYQHNNTVANYPLPALWFDNNWPTLKRPLVTVRDCAPRGIPTLPVGPEADR